MQRNIAAVISLAFFMVVVALQTSSLTAQTSPLAAMSPLATTPPTMDKSPAHHETNYNPHPPKVTPRPVPFIDDEGATVVKQEVIEYPDRDPLIVNVKATPQSAIANQKANPLTFQSPLGVNDQVYLPLVRNGNPPRVLAIAFIYTTPYIVITDAAHSLAAQIMTGTRFHGTGASAINFEILNNRIEITTTYPPYSTTVDNIRHWDLKEIYSQFNICNRVATEDVDEVWIWIGGDTDNPNYVYGTEWEASGPYVTTNYSVFAAPNCGRQMFTIGLNYHRTDGVGLESWGHSAEFAFQRPELSSVQSCDFLIPDDWGLYSGWTFPGCNGIGYSSTNGFVQLPRYDYNQNLLPSDCGDVHFPPNIDSVAAIWGSWRYDPYDYNNPQVRPSRCTDWQWDVLTNSVPISCGVWGCYQDGYLMWWMQNVPGLNNNLHGRDDSLRPNWWNFRLAP